MGWGILDTMKQILISVPLLLPFIASAQFGGINTFFENIMSFINGVLIPFIFAIALFMFIYGMYKYFIQGGANENDRAAGQKLLISAVVGFVAMVSIWGVVNLIAGGLNFTDSNVNNIPSGPSPK